MSARTPSALAARISLAVAVTIGVTVGIAGCDATNDAEAAVAAAVDADGRPVEVRQVGDTVQVLIETSDKPMEFDELNTIKAQVDGALDGTTLKGDVILTFEGQLGTH